MTAPLSADWKHHAAKHGERQFARPVQPGTRVPWAWCTVHRTIVDDDPRVTDVRRDKHDHAWCGADEDDADNRRCHMVALVTGDDL